MPVTASIRVTRRKFGLADSEQLWRTTRFLKGSRSPDTASTHVPHRSHTQPPEAPPQRLDATALRAGVAGGVLSTMAVAGARRSGARRRAGDADPRMPTLTADLATSRRRSPPTPRSRPPLNYELQAERDAAAAKAAKAGQGGPRPRPRRRRRPRRRPRRPPRPRPRPPMRASRSRGPYDCSSATAAPPPSPPRRTRHRLRRDRHRLPQGAGRRRVRVGGTGPNSWDCSGLVQAAFRAGRRRPAARLAGPVDRRHPGLPEQPSAGDILYWGGAGSAYHVGVYVGGGQFVGAQNPCTGVVLRSLGYDPPSGAVRVL